MEIQLKQYAIVELDYRIIKPLQGNLKTLSTQDESKLLASLRENGKFVPELVWLDESENTWYTLDGHTRLSIYKKHDVRFGGKYDVPFVKIEASDKEDAARKLLLINADYAKLSADGFAKFADLFNIHSEWLNKAVSFSQFANFDFVDQHRAAQKQLQRDLLPLQNMMQNMMPGNLQNRQPTATDAHFNDSHFENANYAQSQREYDTPTNENITRDFDQHLTTNIPNAQMQSIPDYELENRAPRATDDEFQSISEVVLYTDKLKFNEVILGFMQREQLTRRHDALNRIIDFLYTTFIAK